MIAVARTASVSDTGRKRRRNEDAFVCEPPLFAVADGMGGAQAGEIASRLAARALQGESAGAGALDGEQRVASLIQEANRRVYQRANEDAAVSGMGTTMTVALVEDGRVAIGHVGDSRAYLIRDGRLEQLTQDHSLVAELVRSGKISPEEAETHPQRSVITRALGTDPDVDVDTFAVEAQPGDLFLLCSDGLTSMVDEDVILAAVDEHRDDLSAAARALVAAANRGGGEDNITVVFFELAEAAGVGGPESAPTGDGQLADMDDEDTLSELDRVPALETRVEEATDERAAPRPRRLRRRLTVLFAVLAVLALASAAGLWLISRSHFVGAQADGRVAVYQGVPYDIVGDVRLYRARYVSRVVAAQLTQSERRRLFDHDLRGYGSALSAVKRLERDVSP